MPFHGPDSADYRNVVALNHAYLTLLQRDLHARQELTRNYGPLARKIAELTASQIAHLAATPFLILSFRESDEAYWRMVLRGLPERDLFATSATGDLETLAAAGLGFVWQLARQNPYALRLVCGASLHWCEQIAEQTFFNLLASVLAHGDILQLRAAQNHELWLKLLGGGVSRNVVVRKAAHISALQEVLTQPQRDQQQLWAVAARKIGAPGLRVADDPLD